jgi:hypothetical protein
VGQDQAAERRDLQPVAGALLLHIRPAKQQQRRWLARRIFPVPLNGGDFRRLVLQGVQAVHIADQRLDGATSSVIHSAIENILRIAGDCCRAADARPPRRRQTARC